MKKGLVCSNVQEKKGSELVIIHSRGQGKKLLITSTQPHASPSKPLAHDDLHLLFYFDLFTKRNSFTGKSRTFGHEVQALEGRQSRQAGHLNLAMLAVGALYEMRSSSPPLSPQPQKLSKALYYYSLSVSELREALQHIPLASKTAEEKRLQILWTTLLLGLFEVSWTQVFMYSKLTVEADERRQRASLEATHDFWHITSPPSRRPRGLQVRERPCILHPSQGL